MGIDTNNQIIKRLGEETNFIPNYVVVNAGGNDYNAYINNLSGEMQSLAVTAFTVILQVGENGLPQGANAHAGLQTHIQNAEIVANVVSSAGGLQRARDNIALS